MVASSVSPDPPPLVCVGVSRDQLKQLRDSGHRVVSPSYTSWLKGNIKDVRCGLLVNVRPALLSTEQLKSVWQYLTKLAQSGARVVAVGKRREDAIPSPFVQCSVCSCAWGKPGFCQYFWASDQAKSSLISSGLPQCNCQVGTEPSSRPPCAEDYGCSLFL